jgi:putative endonuclease
VDPEVVEVAGSARGERSSALGRWGEDLAAAELAAGGLQVLARNWRCARGELDLVGLEADGTVVFVEVKTRAGTGFGSPAEAVGWRKAGRIRRLACAWLAEHRPAGTTGLRFDVVGIVKRPGAEPEVTHLRGAF